MRHPSQITHLGLVDQASNLSLLLACVRGSTENTPSDEVFGNFFLIASLVSNACDMSLGGDELSHRLSI